MARLTKSFERRPAVRISEKMDPEMMLMARLADGDEGALAELYGRLSANIYALALRMLHSPEEAEEVLQDTFLRGYRKAGTYRPDRGSPRAFLYTIARNEALSRLRARASRPVKAGGWDVHNPHTTLAAVNPGDLLSKVMLAGALETLEPDEVELLRLAFFDGYSHAELCQLTGLPLGTVKSKVRRALAQLREYLEAHEPS